MRWFLSTTLALGASALAVAASTSMSSIQLPISSRAVACIQTCNNRVNSGETWPCDSQVGGCKCSKSSFTEQLSLCFASEKSCDGFAQVASSVLTLMCDGCSTATSCSISTDASNLLIKGRSGGMASLALPSPPPQLRWNKDLLRRSDGLPTSNVGLKGTGPGAKFPPPTTRRHRATGAPIPHSTVQNARKIASCPQAGSSLTSFSRPTTSSPASVNGFPVKPAGLARSDLNPAYGLPPAPASGGFSTP
ncbi:hypothetical protein EXIGLDRAFT_736867, partial [Exidia glandulosa HHB12029]